MKLIPITQGLFAQVDDEDYEWLSQWKWCAMSKGPRSKGFYACRQTRDKGKKTTLLMHRAILDTPKGLDTDHINNDGLDNRRENLRAVDRTQNNYNSGMHSNNKSGVKGVSWFTPAKLWRAYIGGSKTRKELGYFKDIEDAKNARIKAEREIICA